MTNKRFLVFKKSQDRSADAVLGAEGRLKLYVNGRPQEYRVYSDGERVQLVDTTRPNGEYRVDTAHGTCTCPQARLSRACEHRDAIRVLKALKRL